MSGVAAAGGCEFQMKSLFKLIRESGVSIRTFVFIAFLACVSSLLAVLPPHFLGASINAIAGSEFGDHTISFSPITILNQWLGWAVEAFALNPVVLFLALFFIFNLLYLAVRNLFAVYVSLFADRFILFIRQRCLSKIVRSQKRELVKFESGDLVHRTMNDTQQLDFLIGNPLYTLCSDILDLIWISAIILMIDWKIPPILISVVPLLYLISRKTGHLQKKYAGEVQKNEAACTGFIQRAVMGLDNVKACQGEQREIEHFEKLNKENYVTRKKSSVNLGFFFPQEGALRAIGTIAVISYAAFLATKNAAFIGTIPVLLIYATKFYAPLGNWARYYQTIQRGIVSYHRLLQILSLKEEPHVSAPPADLESLLPVRINGSIALESGKNVRFDLEATRSGLILIKGKSGVGKTRLLKSLIGLGCEFEGTLKLAGKNYEGQELRPHTALATQDGHFIPGTLAENLSYPSKKTDKAKCEQILQYLCLDYDLDHQVGEYGRNLSAGEQRRVIFGRALYSEKPVMILDEIDANVDEETRKQLYQIIQKEKSERIIIMVSHVHKSELNDHATRLITISQTGV